MKTLKSILAAFFTPVTTGVGGCLHATASAWVMRALALCTMLVIAGCGGTNRVIQVIPKATGGGGGVVELSYEREWDPFNFLGKKQVNWQAAQSNAVKRCKAWGYSGASRFDAETQRCISRFSDGGCSTAIVTIKYQCTK